MAVAGLPRVAPPAGLEPGESSARLTVSGPYRSLSARIGMAKLLGAVSPSAQVTRLV